MPGKDDPSWKGNVVLDGTTCASACLVYLIAPCPASKPSSNQFLLLLLQHFRFLMGSC